MDTSSIGTRQARRWRALMVSVVAAAVAAVAAPVALLGDSAAQWLGTRSRLPRSAERGGVHAVSTAWTRHRSVRLVVLVAMAAAISWTPLGPRPATASGLAEVPTLADEDVHVWPEQAVNHVKLGYADGCANGWNPCWDHQFEITEGVTGSVRVALDVRLANSAYVRDWADPAAGGEAYSGDSSFRLEVYEPPAADGKRKLHVADKKRPYSQELWVKEPATPGRWLARVIPLNVERRVFRVRAGVDVLEPLGADGMPLYPNLRAVPAFELTFNVPTTNYGPGVHHAATTGACMIEESVEGNIDFDRRRIDLDCLRFSFGMENTGQGPLILDSVNCLTNPLHESCTDSDPSSAVYQRWMVTSRSPAPAPGAPYRTEAPSRSYAGTARFDPTHGHTHYEEAWSAKLLRVATDGWEPGDRHPKVVQVGAAPKLGFDPAAESISGLEKLTQDDPAWLPYRLGSNILHAGWADNYEWNRSGNAIPLEGPLVQGWYLLQTFVDPFGHITETNDGDNTSYTMFEVTVEDGKHSISIHERGVGTGPWERPRRLATTIP